MSYVTKECENCQNRFVWSQEEQDLYRERGLAEPKYCPICRGMMEARKSDKARSEYER